MQYVIICDNLWANLCTVVPVLKDTLSPKDTSVIMTELYLAERNINAFNPDSHQRTPLYAMWIKNYLVEGVSLLEGGLLYNRTVL